MTINELISQLEYVRDELDNNTEQDTPARDCFWELNDIVADFLQDQIPSLLYL